MKFSGAANKKTEKQKIQQNLEGQGYEPEADIAMAGVGIGQRMGIDVESGKGVWKDGAVSNQELNLGFYNHVKKEGRLGRRQELIVLRNAEQKKHSFHEELKAKPPPCTGLESQCY